jgi:tetratricopeptide (TPR) repeat protein
MKNQFTNKVICSFLLLCGVATVDAAEVRSVEDEIQILQSRWAEINYQLDGKVQLTAFSQLVNEAGRVISTYPEQASPWIWSGIIKSTYAGAMGGLGALSLAKEAKKDLEEALSIDETALEGSAYTSLGSLYANVPGWPIGFGDNKKAEKMLQQALELNPQGIDSNYFYAQFLIEEKRYAEARYYLEKAAAAPARPERPLADSGRHEEIDMLLAEIAGKD